MQDLSTILIAISKCDDKNMLRQINSITVGKLRALNANENVKASAQFRVGDKVEWDGKYGNTEQGVITKINPKTIKVRTDRYLWTVSATLLRKA